MSVPTHTSSQSAAAPGAMLNSTPAIRVELLSQAYLLCGARDLVSSVAKRMGFCDTECGQLALAVDEALCNIIRHGYDRRGDGRIWLSIWPISGPNSSPISVDGIRIEIEDEAKQVDPAMIKGRELDDIKPGGLGVYIIRQVMDTVSYEKRNGLGMRLVLTKSRTGSGAEEEG